MILGLEVLVRVVADCVMYGLLDALILLEPDLRVPHHHGPHPARTVLHWSSSSGSPEVENVLELD